MKIRRYIIIIMSIVCLQLLAQKKELTSAKKKNEIIFSNDQDTKAYLNMLENALNRVSESYVDSVNESELIKAGIKGMMKPLDPYTKFLSGSSKDRLDMLRTGKYGGVGIQIGLRRDTLTVLTPFEDSPAYTEGIHSGDQIIKIDTTLSIGLNVKEASELIKGEIDSVVVLGILRPATKEKIDFELKRANIRVKHVPYWGVDENNIGYIKLSRFSRNAAKDFKEALISFDESNINGLIIDLRGNSGGLLNNSINILDYLTDRGELLLSSRGKSNRSNKLENLKSNHFVTIPATMDKELVAHEFERFDLVSAPVIDENDRLIGVITADDIVDVIKDEAGEDIKFLGGVGDENITDNVLKVSRGRFSWLFINLLTAILASIVIGIFDATIQEMVALAILMPIVASMGGNAGTQTLTIAVRSLSTRELVPLNYKRIINKEILVSFYNGMFFAIIIGVLSALWFSNLSLGAVLAFAMVLNMVIAGLSGILIPLSLNKVGIDPAIASTVFLTTITDVVGFFVFLGLAAWLLV